MARPWEDDYNEAPARSRKRPWEDESDTEPPAGGPEPDSDDENIHVESAGPEQDFIAFMLDLHWMRRLNAREVCVAMWLLGKCGLKDCAKLGLEPGKPSGHYNRKIKRETGDEEDKKHGYAFTVPGGQKTYTLGRTPHLSFGFAAHELLNARVDSSARLRLREAIEEDDVPPCYHDHPVVTKYGASACVFPWGLYMDGVPYSIEDSVIGFWLVDLLTSERILFYVLRRRTLCTCGCRGWCTFAVVFMYILWQLFAMAEGVMPRARHDRQDWDQTYDVTRAAHAGEPLRAHHALMWLSGDWSEYAHTLGFPQWSDGLRPCFECNADLGNMLSWVGRVRVNELPWRPNADEDYFLACERCERWVRLDSEDHKLVVSLLMYDKRQEGSHGRALVSPGVPHLGLRQGDRLEPSPSLMDIGEATFDVLDVTEPVWVVFWRPSAEYLTRHRNPIFDREIGVTPHRSMTIDMLHCIHLGFMLAFVKTVVWHLLINGKWGRFGTLAESLQLAALRLRNELETWYKARHSANPTELLTRAHITASELGSHSEQKCKLKGAQTWAVFLYLIDVLGTVGVTYGNECLRFLEAALALKQCIDLLTRSPRKLDENTRKDARILIP